jgi:hypothetical protein
MISLRDLSAKKFLGMMFRLSLVVGIVAAGWDAYKRLDQFSQENERYVLLKLKMDCAVGISSERLAPYQNEHELYDISPFCGVNEKGEKYFVSPEELKAHREGRFMEENDYRGARVDLSSNLVTFLGYVFLVNAIGLALIALVKVARWVVGR